MNNQGEQRCPGWTTEWAASFRLGHAGQAVASASSEWTAGFLGIGAPGHPPLYTHTHIHTHVPGSWGAGTRDPCTRQSAQCKQQTRPLGLQQAQHSQGHWGDGHLSHTTANGLFGLAALQGPPSAHCSLLEELGRQDHHPSLMYRVRCRWPIAFRSTAEVSGWGRPPSHTQASGNPYQDAPRQQAVPGHAFSCV